MSPWTKATYTAEVQIEDYQVIGDELAVKWDDGKESYLSLEALRRHCPCAGCKGETDVMGNVYRGPEIQLTLDSFRLVRIDRIGSYALQPIWGDGHATGLYAFEYLRAIAESK